MRDLVALAVEEVDGDVVGGRVEAGRERRRHRLSDGTALHGPQTLPNGNSYDADANNAPVAMDIYFIVPDKCTECTGFHDEPQCAAVCPVDCCVDDPEHRETKEQLLAKKEFMHL